jgi:hypothetical protein
MHLIIIYGILLLLSIIGMLHSMYIDDMHNNGPMMKKFSKWYFRMNSAGCIIFGILFCGKILRLW